MASKIRRRRDRTEKVLRPVHPNAGIAAAYQKRLDGLIDDLHASVMWWLRAEYRANPPKTLATDESAAEAMRKAIKRLVKRWLDKFDEAAEKLASYFAQSAAKRSDAALKKILKDGGISVEWRMSRAQQEILSASVQENVALIKSIPRRYLEQVEVIVMQSVQTGRDLGQLTADLQKQFGVTKRRAALISKDQNSKITAALNRARQLEIGVEEAVWLHSHAGKRPRPSHVKAGRDKVRYKVAEGWLDPAINKRIWPGTEINCFPGDTSLQFAKDVKKAFRHWYSGNLSELITDTGKTLRATPNHPVLTPNGWIAIGLLQEGDYVIQIADEGVFSVPIELNEDDAITSISQAFDAVSRSGFTEVALGANFHGDIVDGNVDVVFAADPLTLGGKAGLAKSIEYLPLADANISGFGFGAKQEFVVAPGDASHSIVGRDCQRSASFGADAVHSNSIGVASVAPGNAILSQDARDDNPLVPPSETDSDREFAFAASVSRDDGRLVNVMDFVGGRMPPWDQDTSRAQMTTKTIGGDAQAGANFNKRSALRYKALRVVNNMRRHFSGHVYTLETESGWFSVSPDAIVVKNCRCVSKPVIKGFS